jgi:hypothetical protein
MFSVYAFESGAAVKNEKARELLRGLMEGDGLRTSTQVLREFM